MCILAIPIPTRQGAIRMKYHANSCWILLLLLYGISSSAIITVDNKSPYAGQYRTLQEAHDAASAGDIIYVSPSLMPYTGIVVTKQLTFYGVGFEITHSLGGALSPVAIITGLMQFVNGSAGSQLEGFDGSFQVIIAASNITIKRNKLSQIAMGVEGRDSSILQNIIDNSNLQDYTTISVSGATNVIIANNLIKNIRGFGNDHWGYYYAIIDGSDLLIKNNVIKVYGYAWTSSNSQMVNNIIVVVGSGSIQGIYNFVRYNMTNTVELPVGDGNINNIDMATVFVDINNNDYHLLPNSPAKGTGENGADMGIYGGDAPYIDGGFPSLPSILQLKGDLVAAPGTGLNVQFKAKSNK